jgi:hypothetical protein
LNIGIVVALSSWFAVLNVAIAGTINAYRFHIVLNCIEPTSWIAGNILYRELKSTGRQSAVLKRHRYFVLLPSQVCCGHSDKLDRTTLGVCAVVEMAFSTVGLAQDASMPRRWSVLESGSNAAPSGSNAAPCS